MTTFATVDGANVSFEGLSQPVVTQMLAARGAAFEILDEATFTARQATAKQAAIDAAAAQAAAAAPENARLAAIDTSIAGFSFGGQTLAQLKAMDNTAFDTWWTANVTNLAQANAVLKLVARTMLRKVL